MRIRPTIFAFLTCACLSLAHQATASDVRAERQASLDEMLTSDAASNIATYRADCAGGRKVAGIARSRAMGMASLPDAVEYCVTALIRTGRDRNLRPLQTPNSGITPALALDSGFVSGYHNGGDATAMPTVEALRASAERCFAQSESDKDLCYSVGYAYGVRAAGGETMHAN